LSRNDSSNIIISTMKMLLKSASLTLLLLGAILPWYELSNVGVIVYGFVHVAPTNPRTAQSILTGSTATSSKSPPLSRTTPSALFAGGAKTKKKRSSSSSTANKSGGGFGGAAMEPCPCGSGDAYSGCCGRLHKDVNAFRLATAEQVVRARYSAYAKKQAEFLMASTHPMNKAFDTDLKRWRDTIRYGAYFLRCMVLMMWHPHR
jgi:hypothetical protein